MPTPFSDRRLRDWWFRNATARDIGFQDVSLMGTGPFGADDMERFLARTHFDVWESDHYTEVLILGTEDWSEQALRSLLGKRSGSTLRVYSQEMFLAYLISGNDPLDNERVALLMGRGHAGLEALMALNFEWPSIDVAGFGDGRAGAHAWRSEGFLKAMGYRVGNRAEAARGRHRALVRAFQARVPKRFREAYAEFWGRARTSLRLERMAKSIARQYRLAVAVQGNDYTQALDDWAKDLRWLKRKYYQGRYRFRWPSIHVH